MERRRFTIRGLVQGVGFRPFVYGLATQLGLQGSVQNGIGSVHVEVEGEQSAIDQFHHDLEQQAPPFARIEHIEITQLPVSNETGFRIKQSLREADCQVAISPDLATCQACLDELFDPADRRYQYPFINCTQCGPRLTIIFAAPYDRERTTMASFAMCRNCRMEYEDPNNRRFHAQPIACPECGPQLKLLTPKGQQIGTENPLAMFVDFLQRGKIGAMKGVGGFHLVCLAGEERAVDELRRRKHRQEKPFAIMVNDAKAAQNFCHVGPQERLLLESSPRPIVLLKKRQKPNGTYPIAESVAPANPYLGVMLPYTPLHSLLLNAIDGLPLVMTSGNQSDEPIAYLDDDAIVRLNQIADVFLMHDRPIFVRCDDSVMRIVGEVEQPIRRSRGYAPEAIKLMSECPGPILAVGGQLKNTFCIGQGTYAIQSHHIGDLDDYASITAFERDIRLYEELFDLQPQWIAYDLHPEYASTGYAKRRASEDGISLVGVQHHHAHMASCMAEHGLHDPVIGVIFDGTGYGLDNTIWGGEFLVGDYRQFVRAAHLRTVRLPGGDQAVRNPWRMAVSYLRDAGCPGIHLREVSPHERNTIERMISRGFNSPWTSSAGRLFDAVAALIGLRSRVSYEGQAAQELEWLATATTDAESYPFELIDQNTKRWMWSNSSMEPTADEETMAWKSPAISVDTRPLIRAVVKDLEWRVETKIIARRFHTTLLEMIAAVCQRIQSIAKIDAVVLSGGVFQNALLSCEANGRLTSEGFRVFQQRRVPANDGGLSLGQLAIAAEFWKRILENAN